jgi:hypothetical protein
VKEGKKTFGKGKMCQSPQAEPGSRSWSVLYENYLPGKWCA